MAQKWQTAFTPAVDAASLQSTAAEPALQRERKYGLINKPTRFGDFNEPSASAIRKYDAEKDLRRS